MEPVEQGGLSEEETRVPGTDPDAKLKSGNRRKRPVLNDALLLGKSGVPSLEQRLLQTQFRDSHGRELHNLSKLMRVYREWALDMFPRFSFEETVAKVEKLGTTRSVQGHMNHLRELRYKVTAPERPKTFDELAPDTNLEDHKFSPEEERHEGEPSNDVICLSLTFAVTLPGRRVLEEPIVVASVPPEDHRTEELATHVTQVQLDDDEESTGKFLDLFVQEEENQDT